MKRPTAASLYEAAEALHQQLAGEGVELPRPANQPGGIGRFARALWVHLSVDKGHGLPRPSDDDSALLRFLTASWTALEGAALEKAQGPFGRTTSIASPAGLATHSDPEDFVFSAGMILATGWNGADQPGWLYCDGRSLLTADYPVLYAAIAGRFGAADGTHFNIPDLRGRFLRGFDDATGRDPDAAGRTAMATGGATGDAVGSVQGHDVLAHAHTIAALAASGVVGGGGTIAVDGGGASLNTGTTPTSGGNETRPINAGVAYYIKT